MFLGTDEIREAIGERPAKTEFPNELDLSVASMLEGAGKMKIFAGQSRTSTVEECE